MQNTTRLEHTIIFEDIPSEAIQEICAQGEFQTFEPQQQLFNRGEDANCLMILQQGEVELYFPVTILGATKELTLERKQPGEVVAWSALVHPHKFTVSGRCADRCVVCSLQREALHSYFTQAPEIGYLFMRNLARIIGSRLQTLQLILTQDLETSLTKRLG